MHRHSDPYTPPLSSVRPPLDAAEPSPIAFRGWRKLLALVAFVPGAVVGLNLASAIQEGIVSTFNKTLYAPWDAIQAFMTWALISFAFTSPWRVLRRFWLWRHRAHALATFVSATLGTTAFYLIAHQVDDLQFFIGLPGPARVVVIMSLALAVGSASVECEAHLYGASIEPSNYQPREPAD